MLKRLHNNSAFTLIELLVTISIFTFLMGAVYSTFLVGNRSWMTASDKVALQREARWALFAITKELREAQDIFITNDITSTRIDFNRPTVGKVTYSLDSVGSDANKIIRQEGSRKRIIARDISYLSFTYLTTDAITVEIAATRKPVWGPEISFYLKGKVVLRL